MPPLYDLLVTHLGPTWAALTAVVVPCLIVFLAIQGVAGFSTYVERKIAAAKSGLDGNLPNAGGAEQYLDFAAFDRGARLTIQPAGLGERLKQNMRVEQHPHQRPSNASMTSSGNGASKSSGTRSFPVKMPR